MDFGIARPVDVSLHTVAGTVPGTVAYLSPEACTGVDVDFRSDIYQFGLCLYEFIFGVAAFPQSDLTSLLEAKSSNKYQLPSDMVKGINSRIIPVLQRCLQLDPEMRYHSAYSCLVELKSIYASLSFPENHSGLLSSFFEGNTITFNSVSKTSKFGKTVLLFFFFFLALPLSVFFCFHYYPNFFNHVFSHALLKPVSSKTVSTYLSDSSFCVDSFSAAHIPSPVPKTPPVSSVKKPKSFPVRDTVVSIKPPVVEALLFIEKGEHQYNEGYFKEALASFQSAIKIPGNKDYWLARYCFLSLLFLQYCIHLIKVNHYL